MARERVDAVVVGAGICGLACAYWLRRRGRSVVIAERAPRAGGVIESTHASGFLVEAGPNSTLETNPAFGNLFSSVGVADARIVASRDARKRFILRGGKLHALPMSPLALIKTTLFSPSAKVRLLAEPFVRRGTSDDEGVWSFFNRRFGKEIADYAVDPFVSGVYAGDASRLGVRSAFPSLSAFESNSGSVLRGAIGSARGGRRGAMVSFGDGMETLTSALVRSLGDALRLQRECVRLERGDAKNSWRVIMRNDDEDEVVECDTVVLAAPADTARRLIEPLDRDGAAELSSIEYAPVATVFLGYDRNMVDHPLDGFGFLVPSREHRDILGVIFSSTLFDRRSPSGSVALTAFAGGAMRPELVHLDDDDLTALVTAELDRIVGTRGKPDFVKIRRWKRAIPQYNSGHHAVVERLHELETHLPGLYFCANYTGGISVADCARTATTVADSVNERLSAGV